MESSGPAFGVDLIFLGDYCEGFGMEIWRENGGYVRKKIGGEEFRIWACMLPRIISGCMLLEKPLIF